MNPGFYSVLMLALALQHWANSYIRSRTEESQRKNLGERKKEVSRLLHIILLIITRLPENDEEDV